jgi:hypothetical protein
VKDMIPAEVGVAWDSFQQAVNMTSVELRAWLLIEAPGADEVPCEAGLALSELGQLVVELLRKRKADLTERDADVMELVVEFVLTQEARGPADRESGEEWRRALMTVGHDPLRP